MSISDTFKSSRVGHWLSIAHPEFLLEPARKFLSRLLHWKRRGSSQQRPASSAARTPPPRPPRSEKLLQRQRQGQFNSGMLNRPTGVGPTGITVPLMDKAAGHPAADDHLNT